MADVASKQQTVALFLSTVATRARRHTELTKKLTNLKGKPENIQFSLSCRFLQSQTVQFSLVCKGTLRMVIPDYDRFLPTHSLHS